MMRVAVLTSSRADYGIYLPLLKKLRSDDFFTLKIIAFGTHLSGFHGNTIEQIEQDGFEVTERLETLILGDSETAISNAIGNTISRFASVWERLKDEVDWVFALGDRYEMLAAVVAAVPFNVKIAHLHGGETTLGAIDDKFRHAITQMSSLHFTSTKEYARRVEEMLGSDEGVYHVGALSLDNVQQMDLLDVQEFNRRFSINLSAPTILTTFHPETVSLERNKYYMEVLVESLSELALSFQILITMPNADTMGNMIRERFLALSEKSPQVICIENLGSEGYLSCIKHCAFMLGNTSSGIIEAASLGKYVINLGDRQAGRVRSCNVVDVPVEKEAIMGAVREISGKSFTGKNVYAKSDSKESASSSVILLLKKIKL